MWTKDRGTEPRNLRPKADFPWFWSAAGDGSEAARTGIANGDTFDGKRWNDFHCANAAKRTARRRAKDAASK